MIHVHGYLGQLSDDTRALARTSALVVGGRRHLADLGVEPERQVVLGALTPGQSMLITSDHDPRPLHYQLETNFPGQFGWDYLEQGPEVWRVEIDRLEDGGCDCCCGSDH